MTVAEMLLQVFQTPNESDSNGEAANVVDGLYALKRAVFAANVTSGEVDGVPGRIRVADGLVLIAIALQRIADVLEAR